MRKSEIKIALNDEEFSLEEAAVLLDYDKMKLINLVNRAPEGFKLREKDNVIVRRIDTPKTKRGILIVRESDHKQWSSVKALAADLNVNKVQLAYSITKKHCFEYKGEKYIAPNYIPRKLNITKPKAKRIEIEPLNEKPLFNEVPHIQRKTMAPTLSTEHQAFELLRKLAIERIQNTEYDKASKVLSALEMLTQ